MMTLTPIATRIVLVDETGRVYDRNDVQIVIQRQDDGQTIKVFVKPRQEAV